MVDVEDVQVTGDQAVDARNAKRIQEAIARLKKNQDRRLQRKNAQIIKAGGTPIGDMHTKTETVSEPNLLLSFSVHTGHRSLAK